MRDGCLSIFYLARHHGQRFHKQAITDALVLKNFMGIIWNHVFDKDKFFNSGCKKAVC